MFLLNKEVNFDEYIQKKNLQYKMFLLNVKYFKESIDRVGFTIQNVPIKS